MVTKLIILGIGGNSIDILDTINDINRFTTTPRYECVGFLDDNAHYWQTDVHGKPVLGALHTAPGHQGCQFVNGIGSTASYLKKCELIANTGMPPNRFETVIHPTASVSGMSNIGAGSVIFQQVTVTSNVRIGRHVIILPNSVISHDSEIGDYTCIAGGTCVSGNVRIGTSCYLGSNSVIIEDVTLHEGALVGMGSVVLEDVPANTVVVGNPARVIRRKTGNTGPYKAEDETR